MSTPSAAAAAVAAAQPPPVFRQAHKALLRRRQPLFLRQPGLVTQLDTTAGEAAAVIDDAEAALLHRAAPEPVALPTEAPDIHPALLRPRGDWQVRSLGDALWLRGVLSAEVIRELAVAALTTWLDPTMSRTNADMHGAGQEKRELDRISWLTLGYHYDWTAKVYREDARSPMPPLLQQVCEALVAQLPIRNGSDGGGDGGKFEAQAAIVNVYSVDSSLGPHTDHSEEDLEAPLISISLGLPALLLLGGATLDTPPAALRLLSGDILILMGKARLAYHSMPRVLTLELDRQAFKALASAAPAPEHDFGPVAEFMRSHRLNFSVRQVVAAGRRLDPEK